MHSCMWATFSLVHTKVTTAVIIGLSDLAKLPARSLLLVGNERALIPLVDGW